jgi:hypothetical protein
MGYISTLPSFCGITTTKCLLTGPPSLSVYPGFSFSHPGCHEYTPECFRWSRRSILSDSGAPPEWEPCFVRAQEDLEPTYFQGIAPAPPRRNSHPNSGSPSPPATRTAYGEAVWRPDLRHSALGEGSARTPRPCRCFTPNFFTATFDCLAGVAIYRAGVPTLSLVGFGPAKTTSFAKTRGSLSFRTIQTLISYGCGPCLQL